MCKFFRIGKCTKGVQCPFAHHQIELRQQPDLRCTKFCKELLETGVCNNPSCTFAHTKEELRSRGALQKTKLCRNMQAGCCSFGRDCNFAHSPAELCVPDTSLKSTPGFSTPELRVPDTTLPLPPGLEDTFGYEALIQDLKVQKVGEEGGIDEYGIPWGLAPLSWNGDKEESWSGAISNAGSAISTDDISSTTDSDKFGDFASSSTYSSENIGSPAFASSTYGSENIGSLTSNTYGSTLGEPAYVISSLASEFQCDKFAPYMLGDYQVGATSAAFLDTSLDSTLDSTLGFGFDWSSLGDGLVVNQQSGMTISASASANLTKNNMRSVRTSESTLCTLSASPRP
jgi:hypothetical protein